MRNIYKLAANPTVPGAVAPTPKTPTSPIPPPGPLRGSDLKLFTWLKSRQSKLPPQVAGSLANPTYRNIVLQTLQMLSNPANAGFVNEVKTFMNGLLQQNKQETQKQTAVKEKVDDLVNPKM